MQNRSPTIECLADELSAFMLIMNVAVFMVPGLYQMVVREVSCYWGIEGRALYEFHGFEG